MEVHQIRYFRAVAQCRSFTRAALREHVSQPTLSHQILKLEDELGAKLFHRSGRSVSLTSFGEAFLPKAEIILREIQDAQAQIHQLAGIEAGKITVGVIPTIAPFFLPGLLADFVKQHPLIEVKIVEESSTTLIESLREGAVELAIMPLPVRAKWVSHIELARENLYAVVCVSHPLAKEKRLTVKQLAGAPFLFLKDGHCFRDSALDAFRRANVEPRITFETGCFLTILNMVKAGMGISVVPEMAVDENSGCTFIPVKGDRPFRIIGLLRSKDRVRSRPQELFMESAMRFSQRSDPPDEHGSRRAQISAR